MPNPFENEDALFHVLCNSEQQFSLWPVFAELPAGWEQRYGPASRAECVEFVERNWTDIRPRSVRERAAVSR